MIGQKGRSEQLFMQIESFGHPVGVLFPETNLGGKNSKATVKVSIKCFAGAM
jgi:hypothetical protein